MELTYIFVDFENVQPQDLDLLFGQQYRVKVFHGPHQNKLDVAIVKALQPLGEHAEYIQSNKPGKNALDFHIAFWMGRLIQAQESTGRGARFVVVSKDGGFDSLLSQVRSLGYSASQGATIREALCAETPATRLNAPSSVPAYSNSVTTAGDLADLGLNRAPAPAGPVSLAMSMAPKGNDQSASQQTALTKAGPKKGSSSDGGDQPKAAATTKNVIAKHVKTVIAHLRKQIKNRPAKKSTLMRHVPSLLGGKVSPDTVQAVIAALERQGVVAFNEEKVTYKFPKTAKQG
jgi:hypothetical protein